MKVLIQRVKEAAVKVDNEIVGEINSGLLIFLGVEKGDVQNDIDYLVRKILNLRIFENESGRIDKSILDVQGELLVISQFTLCGDVRKGNRPSFVNSELPDVAKKLYTKFIEKIKECCSLKVEEGRFGANMEVSIVNDGPFTLPIES